MGDNGMIAERHGSERLGKLLFDQAGRKLRNIKFFRGYKDVVSVAELEDAVHASLLATRTGRVTPTAEFCDIEQTPIDTRELVKNL
jgi:hypothetical protein